MQEGKPIGRRANGGKAKTSYVWFKWVVWCLKDPVRPLNRAIRSRWVRQGCNVGSSEAKAQMKACISQGLVCTLPSLAKDLAHSRQGRVLTCLSSLWSEEGTAGVTFIGRIEKSGEMPSLGKGVKFPPGGWKLLKLSVWQVIWNLVEKVITGLVQKLVHEASFSQVPHSFIHSFVKDL